MGDEVTVRRCTEDDLADLERTESPGAGITRSLLRRQATGAIVFGAAWRHGLPLGSVVVDLRSDHAPELKHLHVLESARHAGVGTALCAWAEHQMSQKGFARLYLGVGLQNPGARRLYERLGFRPVGTTTTTTYQYADESGHQQWATETDEILVKILPERVAPQSRSRCDRA